MLRHRYFAHLVAAAIILLINTVILLVRIKLLPMDITIEEILTGAINQLGNTLFIQHFF